MVVYDCYIDYGIRCPLGPAAAPQAYGISALGRLAAEARGNGLPHSAASPQAYGISALAVWQHQRKERHQCFGSLAASAQGKASVFFSVTLSPSRDREN